MKARSIWLIAAGLLIVGLGTLFIPMFISKKYSLPWDGIVKVFTPKKAPKVQTKTLQKAPVEKAPVRNLPQVLSSDKAAEPVALAPISKTAFSIVDKLIDSLKNLIGTLSAAGAFLLMIRQFKETKKKKRASRS